MCMAYDIRCESESFIAIHTVNFKLGSLLQEIDSATKAIDYPVANIFHTTFAQTLTCTFDSYSMS